MATTRPFAYNPSLASISGTTQVGDLAIGTTPQDYSSSPGGVTWWMGPDEDPGYVIAYHRNSVPNAAIGGGAVSHPSFWRSTSKNESAFYRTVNVINPGLSSTTASVNWLNSNGYWHNYEGPFTSSVRIGSNVWTSSNLSVTTYRNGDPIPEVNDDATWSTTTSGAYCHVNGDPANDATYGLLYNQYVIRDPRGIGPLNWHIPTASDIGQIRTDLGGASVSGGKMKTVGAEWTAPNTSADNSSGFSALPGGWRIVDGRYVVNVSGTLLPSLSRRFTMWSTFVSSTNGGYLAADFNSAATIYVSGSARIGCSIRLVMD